MVDRTSDRERERVKKKFDKCVCVWVADGRYDYNDNIDGDIVHLCRSYKNIYQRNSILLRWQKMRGDFICSVQMTV